MIFDLVPLVARLIAAVADLENGKVDVGHVREARDIELGAFDWLLVRRDLQLVLRPYVLRCLEVHDVHRSPDTAVVAFRFWATTRPARI